MRPIVVSLLLLSCGVSLAAPPEPQQIVRYRHLVMEAVGKHMSALAMIARGQSDRQGDVLHHARAMHAASTTLGELFPPGTGPADGVETDAKPGIWSDPEGWAAALAAFEAESAKLVQLAESGDLSTFKAQFGRVGGTCGDCHDGYRVSDTP